MFSFSIVMVTSKGDRSLLGYLIKVISFKSKRDAVKSEYIAPNS